MIPNKLTYLLNTKFSWASHLMTTNFKCIIDRCVEAGPFNGVLEIVVTISLRQVF